MTGVVRFIGPDYAWAGLRKPAGWDTDDHGHFNHVTWEAVLTCHGLGHGLPGYGRLICTNGAEVIVPICLTCGWQLSAKQQPHRNHPDRASYPILRDNRLCPGGDYTTPPCERCGAAGRNELHHWAPRHLFDDCEYWPTSYLCPPCHRRWHETTQTGAYWPRRGSAA